MTDLSVTLPDGSIVPVRLVRRRRQRRIILHEELERGSFWLSAPMNTPVSALRSFLRDTGIGWIAERRADYERRADKTVIRCRGRDCRLLFEVGSESFAFTGDAFRVSAPEYAEAEKVFRRWWQRNSLECYEQHVSAWMPVFVAQHVDRPPVRVRPLKAAWAVCYQRPPHIHFSDRLFAVSDELVDYVVLHELTHLVCPGHGPDFKAFLTRWMPDWRKRDAELQTQVPLVAPLWPPQEGDDRRL